MSRFFTYYHRINGVRGSVLGLPAWARVMLTIVALPGIVAVALSIVALVVSLLALLAVTVPVYGLLRSVTGARSSEPVGGSNTDVVFGEDRPLGSAKHVEVTVRDAAPRSDQLQ